jgi:hypothetical protein
MSLPVPAGCSRSERWGRRIEETRGSCSVEFGDTPDAIARAQGRRWCPSAVRACRDKGKAAAMMLRRRRIAWVGACTATFLLAGRLGAIAEISELYCAGTATFPRHSKLPATVNRMPVRIDFDHGTVTGFAQPLTIVNASPDLIEVAGSYKGAAGPVQIRGTIDLTSGRTKVWGSRGRKGRGPLVFLWELVCQAL